MNITDARKIQLGAVLWVNGLGGGHEPSGWFQVRVTQHNELTAAAITCGSTTPYIWVSTSSGVWASTRLHHNKPLDK